MLLFSRVAFPPDIRVEKECRALSDDGHEVFVLSPAVGDRVAPYEELPDLGCTVVRIPQPLRGHGMTRILHQALLPSRRIRRVVQDFVERYELEALHAHDLYAVPPAVWAGRRFGGRLPGGVVADLHENMPAAVRSYRPGLPIHERIGSRMVSSSPWLRFRQRRLLRHCRAVLTVVPEARDRITASGIPPERVHVVSNTEDETTFTCPTGARSPGGSPGPWAISYVGGIGPHRGLDTTLRAVAVAQGLVPDLRLDIVGVRSERERRTLDRRIAALGIEARVRTIPWMPSSDVPRLIARSAVCLVPHERSEHTDTTVPHKLFQYMMCARPVLVSDCAPLRRIVDGTQCGRVFTAGDAASMVEALVWMRTHPAECDEMGRSGRAAALGPYAWRWDRRRLLKVYRDPTSPSSPSDDGTRT